MLVFSQLLQVSLAPIFSVKGGVRQPSRPYLCSGPQRNGRKKATCGQTMTVKPEQKVRESLAECGAGKSFNQRSFGLDETLGCPCGCRLSDPAPGLWAKAPLLPAPAAWTGNHRELVPESLEGSLE